MLGQMMQVGFYGHVRQYKNIQSEIDANIKRVLESGEYVQGPMLKQFEQELASFHGVSHAVGTGNGTDSIWLALMALGIGPGDEVITHPNTFFATAARLKAGLWANMRRECLRSLRKASSISMTRVLFVFGQ